MRWSLAGLAWGLWARWRTLRRMFPRLRQRSSRQQKASSVRRRCGTRDARTGGALVAPSRLAPVDKVRGRTMEMRPTRQSRIHRRIYVRRSPGKSFIDRLFSFMHVSHSILRWMCGTLLLLAAGIFFLLLLYSTCRVSDVIKQNLVDRYLVTGTMEGE